VDHLKGAALLAALLLAGCHDQPAPPSSAASPRPLRLNRAAVALAERAVGELDAALRAGRIADARALLDADLYGALQFIDGAVARKASLRAHLEDERVDATLGEVPLASVRLVSRSPYGVEGSHTIVGQIALVDGRPVVRVGRPADLVEQTVGLRIAGRVTVDPHREWLAADLRLTVRRRGDDPIVLELPGTIGHGRKPLGLHIAEVSQAGAPCPYAVRGELLMVEPVASTAPVELRIRYQGDLIDDDSEFAHDGTTTQARLTDLVPVFAEAADIALDITYPDSYELVASTPPVTSLEVAGDRREDRYHLVGRRFGLYAVPRIPDEPTMVSANGITFSIRGDLDGEVAAAIPAVVAALAPLGPPPITAIQLRVQPAHPAAYPDGEQLGSGILVDWLGQERPGIRRHLLAHEIVHLWFGEAIPSGDSRAMRWWESVTEYVSSWVLDEKDTRDWRYDAVGRHAHMAVEHDRPLASRSSMTSDASHALSYAKGALLLSALEARVGRDVMVRWLGDLLARHRGQRIEWAHVHAAIERAAGPDHARWFRTWLERPGAPDLRWEKVSVEGSRLAATIAQTSDPPFEGDVTLGFRHCDDTVGEARVTLTGRRTSVRVPLPRTTTRIVLDGDYRLPVRLTGQELTDGILSHELPAEQDCEYDE
jgi:hypothetical protein